MSERKQRLLATAYCRCLWPLLTDERSRCAIEVMERFADGQATAAELAHAKLQADEAARETRARAPRENGDHPSITAEQFLARNRASAATAVSRLISPAAFEITARQVLDRVWTVLKRLEERGFDSPQWRIGSTRSLDSLRRCLYTDPPRLQASWLNGNGDRVLRLARAIYEERVFDQMPILGDALEEAGCTDAAILDHCRNHEQHARGCHLVDAIIVVDPNLIEFFARRGAAYYHWRKYAEAIADLDQVIRLDPARSHAHALRSKAQRALEQRDPGSADVSAHENIST